MKIKNRILNLDMIIYQDSDWFKFSLDSVLLANFVTINYRVKKIMDFATGNAPIPMLLSYRTSAQIYGVEYQKCVYELAIQSINENNLENQIHLSCGDVSDLKNKFQSDSFDVVTCNPPYFKTLSSNYFNQNFVKSIARHEIFLNLDIIFRQAFYLLKTGGVFAMVHRTERFIEIIEKMKETGIRIIMTEEDKECFAIIDRELVWHGGMNLLGKVDAWDNLIRIKSESVSQELLGLMQEEFRDNDVTSSLPTL